MPTGYTACVEDGTVTDFRTFATRCLRAMGCCIMQREDGMSDLPKHRKPSDHHINALRKARAEAKRIEAMKGPEICAAMKAEVDDAAKRNAEWAESHNRENARFDAMTASVQAWTPPTKEHENFKAFMLDQLKISRHSGGPYRTTVETNPEKWWAVKLASCQREIDYHTKEHAAELKRCEDSNAWMDAALASFPA